MLFPIRRDGAIPESLSSSRMSSSAGASSLRSRILERDGVVSPVGRAIDRSAPKDLRQSGLGRVDILEVAYIMHLLVSKYSRMQNLLSMFAGTNGKTKLESLTINSPRNMFCTDHFTHTLFDEFVIGVEHLNGKFWLRKLIPRAALGNIGVCQNGEEVIFGHGPLGLTIDLPDGELFNIHLAIGRVLRMSGVGEIISKILREEENYNDGYVIDEASDARISGFALKMALNRLQESQWDESSLTDSRNKQRQAQDASDSTNSVRDPT
ncbi:hypothetical protein V1506DRAFT_463946 [Lipomyces tetrasporus]